MRLLETKDQLQNWEEYRDFLKLQLKRINRPEAFFVSKEKVEFQLNGKPWRLHAVLAGPKVDQCVRKLRKEGVIFREGSCTRKAREITFSGDELQPRHVKEAEKTFLKLRLGYKLIHQEEEEQAAASE